MVHHKRDQFTTENAVIYLHTVNVELWRTSYDTFLKRPIHNRERVIYLHTVNVELWRTSYDTVLKQVRAGFSN
jgi:hypothetical protein